NVRPPAPPGPRGQLQRVAPGAVSPRGRFPGTHPLQLRSRLVRRLQPEALRLLHRRLARDIPRPPLAARLRRPPAPPDAYAPARVPIDDRPAAGPPRAAADAPPAAASAP